MDFDLAMKWIWLACGWANLIAGIANWDLTYLSLAIGSFAMAEISNLKMKGYR